MVGSPNLVPLFHLQLLERLDVDRLASNIASIQSLNTANLPTRNGGTFISGVKTTLSCASKETPKYPFRRAQIKASTPSWTSQMPLIPAPTLRRRSKPFATKYHKYSKSSLPCVMNGIATLTSLKVSLLAYLLVATIRRRLVVLVAPLLLTRALPNMHHLNYVPYMKK